MPYSHDIFMTTIWHTGTHYFRDGIEQKHGRFRFKHIRKGLAHIAGDYLTVYTTFRDPYRTAASWANRGNLKNQKGIDRWIEQWNEYKKLLELDPIVLEIEKGQFQQGLDFGTEAKNQYADELHLHNALDQGNLDYFYRKIPKEIMVLAFECLSNHNLSYRFRLL